MKRRPWLVPDTPYLENTTEVRVRFQEVDALRVVWHGHYLTYFEEGRVAFGREYGLGYQDMLEAGYAAPLVHVELDFHAPARMDDVITIQTRLHEADTATVPFTYRILGGGGQLLCTGFSVQVFTDLEGELSLTQPQFFADFLDRNSGHRVEVSGR